MSLLSAFFSSHNSEAYTYDPTSSPADEFERLCIARQWDETTKNENFEEFFSALHENSSSPLEVFFCKHSVPDFTYYPLNSDGREFLRLRAARQWDYTKFKEVRDEWLVAVERTRSPIVVFLRGQEVAGYRYRSGRAEVEFRKLVGVRRRIWEEGEIEIGRDVKGREAGRRWRASTELAELQAGFYGAVEERFDFILDEITRWSGLRRRRYVALAKLFGVGDAPLTKEEAETVSMYPDSTGV